MQNRGVTENGNSVKDESFTVSAETCRIKHELLHRSAEFGLIIFLIDSLEKLDSEVEYIFQFPPDLTITGAAHQKPNVLAARKFEIRLRI